MEIISMGMELLERIHKMAYQLWEDEGCEHGRDMEYWFRAEALVSNEQANERADPQPTGDEPAPLITKSGAAKPIAKPAAAKAVTKAKATKP